MMRIMLALLLTSATLAAAAAEDKIADKTEGFQKITGYLPLYWDQATDRLFMEISRFNKEFLYQVSLPAGVGVNEMQLDRGQLGDTRVVVFRRVGTKVFIEQPNYRHRTTTTDPVERKTIEDSFARSVIWDFKVEAVEGDRVLVDATKFFVRDAYSQDGASTAELLSSKRTGCEKPAYVFNEGRSSLDLSRTKGFPKNTEVEATLTFTTNAPIDTDSPLAQVAPDPRAVTLKHHHSLIELPDLEGKGAYTPRRFDPRVGLFSHLYADYSAPMNEPIERRAIERYHLVKRDPLSPKSEPTEPIVFYLDRGVPEPIRGALLEGASWWNEAFEAAGFKNGFKVEHLPNDADPMDIRYNTINWVHRATRGLSYGLTVVDPRTGQILKSTITLDSSRARQDHLILSGLVDPLVKADRPATGASRPGREHCQFVLPPDVHYLAGIDGPSDLEPTILARIRQLVAHEIGHGLGLSHNFAASVRNRASVMDYPAPAVEIRDGHLDLSNAYATGIGAYDRLAIQYAYTHLPPETNETKELDRIVEAGIADGMLFLADADARGAGAAHPLANLWDNGDDPVAMLRHEMRVRRIGLEHFGLGNLPEGAPLSLLEARLLPLFLHHRFQLQAAVKSVGGLNYTYAIKTARGPSPARVAEIVPPARQREALQAVLETIRPEELIIPDRILDLIPPVAFGHRDGTTELFTKRTLPAFDALGTASIAADLAISGLLQPERAARLVDYHARDHANPDFSEVLDELITKTWKGSPPQNLQASAISQVVQSLTVTRLMELAANAEASPQVRAQATETLRNLDDWLRTSEPADKTRARHNRATRDTIERFLGRSDEFNKPTRPLPTPAGEPIGSQE